MQSFKKIIWHGSLIALAGIGLAGCDGNDHGGNPNNGGGVIVKPDEFGMAFGAAFGADNNSEPKTVNDGDIVAVSLTSEPVDIK